MSMAPKTPDTPDQAQSVQDRMLWGRRLVLFCYLGLLGLFSVLALMSPAVGGKLWLVQCVPLAIFAPGLWRQRYRTYNWLCFVILLYFTWSVTNLMSPFAHWRDALVLVLSVSLFISAMLTSRWRQQWLLWQNRQLD